MKHMSLQTSNAGPMDCVGIAREVGVAILLDPPETRC